MKLHVYFAEIQIVILIKFLENSIILVNIIFYSQKVSMLALWHFLANHKHLK